MKKCDYCSKIARITSYNDRKKAREFLCVRCYDELEVIEKSKESKKPKESKGKAFIVAINSIDKDMTVYANSKEEAYTKVKALMRSRPEDFYSNLLIPAHKVIMESIQVKGEFK
jgi:hypothetical protein